MLFLFTLQAAYCLPNIFSHASIPDAGNIPMTNPTIWAHPVDVTPEPVRMIRNTILNPVGTGPSIPDAGNIPMTNPTIWAHPVDVTPEPVRMIRNTILNPVGTGPRVATRTVLRPLPKFPLALLGPAGGGFKVTATRHLLRSNHPIRRVRGPSLTGIQSPLSAAVINAVPAPLQSLPQAAN